MSRKKIVYENARKRRVKEFGREETAMEASIKTAAKKHDALDPVELQRDMQKEYMKELLVCIDDYKKNHDGDFYVVVITKHERLMGQMLRNYFMARRTCPTPHYDQTVFKYNHKDEHIQYIWTVPCEKSCHDLRDNALYAAPAERELVLMVLKFFDGSLLGLAKKLNGELESRIVS